MILKRTDIVYTDDKDVEGKMAIEEFLFSEGS